MANIKTLKDLTPGTVFDAGPIDVRVLDHMTNGTTLLIADKAVAWRPFSLEPMKTRPEEAPTPYPNDFSLSYLKDELNGPFLAAFDTAGGPIRSANIVTADWSLADHRGGFGYGFDFTGDAAVVENIRNRRCINGIAKKLPAEPAQQGRKPASHSARRGQNDRLHPVDDRQPEAFSEEDQIFRDE